MNLVSYYSDPSLDSLSSCKLTSLRSFSSSLSSSCFEAEDSASKALSVALASSFQLATTTSSLLWILQTPQLIPL